MRCIRRGTACILVICDKDGAQFEAGSVADEGGLLYYFVMKMMINDIKINKCHENNNKAALRPLVVTKYKFESA